MSAFWITVSILLLIAFIILFYFYIRQSIDLINPNQCPSIEGDYGVKPNTKGVPLKACGDGSQECTSTVNSLNEAVNICNRKFNICQAFSYVSSTGLMTIIDTMSPLEDSANIDTYFRQINFINITR
jgi:hypothetical protein